MSVDVTTALLQATSTLSTTDAPPTLVPGMTYVCQEHTDLNDTVGKVSFVNNMESDVACWYIACDKDVFVTFSTLALDTAILYLYSSSNGVDYTLRKRFTSSEPLPDDLALSGSVYVQFQALSPATMSTVDLDYVCMNPTPQPTLVPGMTYVCQEHTDLNDTSGKVSFVNNMESDVACWHIACDKDVFVTFSTLALDTAVLYLYNSTNSVDYTLRKRFTSSEPLPDDLALSGSVYVQFQALSPATMSAVDLDYVCMNPTPQPATPTLVPGLEYICKEYIELNNTAGQLTYATSEKVHDCRCWHIECDKSVVVTFTNATFYYSSMALYNSTNGVDYTWAKSTNQLPTSMIILTGSAILQFKSDGFQQSEFSLSYVCMEPPPLPTTDAPPTLVPTLVPGMIRICQEHTDLNDPAGKLTYASAPTLSTACWYIVCDKEVVVTILSLALDNVASFRLYSSTNGVDYYVRESFTYQQNGMHPPPIVLNGSVYVQLIEESSNAKVSSFELDYACVGATPQPTTEAPPTRAPGVSRICQDHTDLNNTAGNVTYANNTGTVECWHIACDKDVVITFASLQLDHPVTLDVYSSSNGVDYTLRRDFGSLNPLPESNLLLNGSVYLQLTGSSGFVGEFDLDYVCMDATPAPTTDAPPTLVPGLEYICKEYIELNNTAGNVTYANNASVECWHIECDEDVVITFGSFRLQQHSDLYLYNTSDGVDYSLYTTFFDGLPEDPIVLHGSALLQLSNPYGRISSFELDYACMSVTPQPTTEAPPTLAPGASYMCQEHTDLNETAGHVDFVNNMSIVTCWYIECDKSVMITFTTLSFENLAFLELFSSESGNGTHYTLERIISHPDNTGVGFVLNGSALVQFVQKNDVFSENDDSKVGFNYVCMGATPQPDTDAPPTLAPGVEYLCHDHTDLNDTSGKVSYASDEANTTACWHIECDKSVAITFSDMQVFAQSFLYLYSSGSTSGSATHYTLEKVLFSSTAAGDQLMLDGSALVQFRSGTHVGRSAFDFEYVCQSADGSGRPTWPYVVFPVVGVLSVALGVVALLKSGVFKAKLSKYSLQDGVNNDEWASLCISERKVSLKLQKTSNSVPGAMTKSA